MDSSLTASDVALLNRDGFGGNNSFFWIFALLLLANGGIGYGNRDFGQYATAASQSEILLGQQFQNIDNKIDRLGNGIADATFALNNSIKDGTNNVAGVVTTSAFETQKGINEVRYDMANFAAQTNANTTAQIQKVLDALSTNRMADMQNQINQLQLQNAVCGVVRYPMATTYTSGANPFCNCGCGCGNV